MRRGLRHHQVGKVMRAARNRPDGSGPSLLSMAGGPRRNSGLAGMPRLPAQPGRPAGRLGPSRWPLVTGSNDPAEGRSAASRRSTPRPLGKAAAESQGFQEIASRQALQAREKCSRRDPLGLATTSEGAGRDVRQGRVMLKCIEDCFRHADAGLAGAIRHLSGRQRQGRGLVPLNSGKGDGSTSRQSQVLERRGLL